MEKSIAEIMPGKFYPNKDIIEDFYGHVKTGDIVEIMLVDGDIHKGTFEKFNETAHEFTITEVLELGTIGYTIPVRELEHYKIISE